MENLWHCPECQKCPERPCYPPGTIYIWSGISIVIGIALLIAVGYGCYRLGKFRGHKRGIKKGEEHERRRSEAADYAANQKAAGVANLLALTLARGGTIQREGIDEERLIGGGGMGEGAGVPGMLLMDNPQRRPYQGTQQSTPIGQHMEPLMAPVVNRNSKRYGGSGSGGGDTFII